MAQQELEAALRREGEEKAREVWQAVEQMACDLREETDRKVAAVMEKSRLCQCAETLRLREDAKAVALHGARLCSLAAEDQLAERLKEMAQGLLQEMGDSEGDSLFMALADEIPAFDWRNVKVGNRDKVHAKMRFPDADIETSERISGGLEVQGADGRLVIINTLEKRLAHLWAELLPELMAELRQRIGDDEVAANDTTL